MTGGTAPTARLADRGDGLLFAGCVVQARIGTLGLDRVGSPTVADRRLGPVQERSHPRDGIARLQGEVPDRAARFVVAAQLCPKRIGGGIAHPGVRCKERNLDRTAGVCLLYTSD